MSDSRALYMVELAAIGALGVLVVPRIGTLTLGEPWLPVFFAAGYFVVELMEVELPRGDVSTMASPLIAAAVVMLPAGAVLLSVLPAGLLAQVLAAWGSNKRRFDYHDAARRIVVVLSGFLTFSILSTASIDLSSVQTSLLVGTVVVLADHLMAQLKTAVLSEAPFWREALGGSALQGWMLAAKVVTATLAVVVLPEMAGWGVFVVVTLLVVMRQAFASYVSVRRAYQSTIEALARTVEAQNPARAGHAQRVSDLATEVGRQMNLRGSTLERLAYASLLHDLGDVGQERMENGGDEAPQLTAAAMVAEVGFLAGVVPVLELCDGSIPESAGREDLVTAYIVLVASRTDDFAQALDLGTDSARLKALTPQLSAAELGRIERAFRTASARVEGVLFAYDRASTGV